MGILDDIRGLLIIIIAIVIIAGWFEYNEINCDDLDSWYYIYNTKTHVLKQVHFEIVFKHMPKGEVTIEQEKRDGTTYTFVRISKGLSVSYRDKVLNSIQEFNALGKRK